MIFGTGRRKLVPNNRYLLMGNQIYPSTKRHCTFLIPNCFATAIRRNPDIKKCFFFIFTTTKESKIPWSFTDSNKSAVKFDSMSRRRQYFEQSISETDKLMFDKIFSDAFSFIVNPYICLTHFLGLSNKSEKSTRLSKNSVTT